MKNNKLIEYFQKINREELIKDYHKYLGKLIDIDTNKPTVYTKIRANDGKLYLRMAYKGIKFNPSKLIELEYNGSKDHGRMSQIGEMYKHFGLKCKYKFIEKYSLNIVIFIINDFKNTTKNSIKFERKPLINDGLDDLNLTEKIYGKSIFTTNIPAIELIYSEYSYNIGLYYKKDIPKELISTVELEEITKEEIQQEILNFKTTFIINNKNTKKLEDILKDIQFEGYDIMYN